jgi:xylitol oxidase
MPGMPAEVNWAGNITFQAVRLVRPGSIDELRTVVADSDRVRALGTGHSFSPLADTTGTLVRLSALPNSIGIDASTVTVPAGLPYSDIAGLLHAAGFALANLASLPHITVAGSVATGTHGSGDTLRNLAAAVVGLRLVTAAGDVLSLSTSDADFAGAVVSLGALGIVTELTLAIEPTFTVAQEVRLDVPLDEVASAWDDVFGAGYSVSVFTDYASGLGRVWLKRRLDGPAGSGWLGGRPATITEHPVPGADPAACTAQLGVPGPWHERLPHFRPDLVPSMGDELQSEFFVPRWAAPAALSALRTLGSAITPVLHIAEIRTIKGDDMWLSPAYGRDSVGFHFTWIRDVSAVAPVVSLVEKALVPLEARPHWGKVTTLAPAQIMAGYPRAADFAALRARLDPAAKFANALTSALFA